MGDYIREAQQEPLGAPCLTCDASGKKGATKPTSYNATKAKVLGWSIKSTYSGTSDMKLARDVYCFQHEEEKCGGTCNPDVATSTDCYNRDGMIGARTLQLMANEVIQNPTSKWGAWWLKTITFPSSYLTAVKTPPAASDVRADVAACQGTAGAKHCELLGLSGGSTQASMWTWGALGLIAAVGLYLYSKAEKKKAAVTPTAPRRALPAVAVAGKSKARVKRRRAAPPRIGRFPQPKRRRRVVRRTKRR